MIVKKGQRFIEKSIQAEYPYMVTQIDEMVKDGWRILDLRYEKERKNGVLYYRIAMVKETP
jgi:hypothetical protein